MDIFLNMWAILARCTDRRCWSMYRCSPEPNKPSFPLVSVGTTFVYHCIEHLRMHITLRLPNNAEFFTSAHQLLSKSYESNTFLGWREIAVTACKHCAFDLGGYFFSKVMHVYLFALFMHFKYLQYVWRHMLSLFLPLSRRQHQFL